METNGWKACPDNVGEKRKYSVDKENSQIAKNIRGWNDCTIIGNTPFSPNKVTSWSIKILKSRNNDGRGIYIGVAPFDIDQNEDKNYRKCGWYFYCYESTLYSGPPHSYSGRVCGPRKDRGGYVHTGDSVGAVIDTTHGDLSFVLNEVNFGAAYEEIPLDKPLVPCVILWEEDSVELGFSEIKETVVSSKIPPPSNVAAKSSGWDSITLSWNEVEGASFYQVEVEGSKHLRATAKNKCIVNWLQPATPYRVRVRTVREKEVSVWSDFVREFTKKAYFEWIEWKEFLDYQNMLAKYSVDESNPMIATKPCNSHCIIIGNMPIPPNKVTSWGVRVPKTKKIGRSALVGVAPFDVDQNDLLVTEFCGWFLDCHSSKLLSGPPQNYKRPGKEYGPRKRDGDYVSEKSVVGVVMDTVERSLSFVLNGVDLGVAYKTIPLDKPLVPCVCLSGYKSSFAELITKESKSSGKSQGDEDCIIS